MKQPSDKLTFKEAIQINKRAFVLINRHCPGMFLSKLLFSVFSAFLPYVPIYFSARIINELAGARNVDSLITWILAELLTVVALKLVVAVLQRWKNAKEYSWWFKRQGVLMGKLERPWPVKNPMVSGAMSAICLRNYQRRSTDIQPVRPPGAGNRRIIDGAESSTVCRFGAGASPGCGDCKSSTNK